MITYAYAISVEAYNHLRTAVGWRPLAPEQAEAGLRGTAFLTVAMDGDIPVGMARVVSDGGYVAYIADVIVLPEYQGQGIGRTMMGQAMAHIRGQLQPGWRIQAALTAAVGKEPFYEKFGFMARNGENTGMGMTQWLEGGDPCPPV